MPYFCRSLVSQALNHAKQKSVKGSKVLILGVAYKPDIGDMRESPALKLISLLQNAGADVSYHDPHVPRFAEHGLEMESVAARPGRLRLRRDRHRPPLDRLRRASSTTRASSSTSATRPARNGNRTRRRSSSCDRRSPGLGYWGPNLARNFDELGELSWLCDLDDGRRERFAGRYPERTLTELFDELLADDDVEAVVIATPVPTHYALAKQALEAGKHVLVEKPPAMRAAEIDELVAIAAERDLVLMPGHLLLYHPGVRKLKELIDAGELGEVLCVYGNRQNLGIVRKNENALWSLGVHDLSVILYLLDEEPDECVAHGRDFLTPGVEDVVFCYLRFPSGKIAHMHLSWLDPHKMRKITVVGREKMVVFDDMELERKVTVYEKSPWKRAESYGEWQTRSGDIFIPKIPTDEPLKLECQEFLRLVAGEGDRRQGRGGRRSRRARARPADGVAA